MLKENVISWPISPKCFTLFSSCVCCRVVGSVKINCSIGSKKGVKILTLFYVQFPHKKTADNPPEQCFFCAKNLYSWSWMFCQIEQWPYKQWIGLTWLERNNSNNMNQAYSVNTNEKSTDKRNLLAHIFTNHVSLTMHLI